MYLIVGLGNPEVKYLNTRHNIGFMVIDSLAEELSVNGEQNGNLYVTGSGEYDSKKVIVMQPLTYMNLSGKAVIEYAERFEIPKENILIVYDDVNLNLGTVRLRPSGSDGGHNGIKSVMYEFASDEIPRMRIGIRNDEELDKLKNDDGSIRLVEFVLDDFTDDEFKALEKVIDAAKDAALSFVKYGLKETMNRFNKDYLALPGQDNSVNDNPVKDNDEQSKVENDDESK